MKSHTYRGVVAQRALGVAVLVLAAAPVGAQSEPTASIAAVEIAQIPTTPVGRLPAQIERPYWSTSSGFEGDTHGTGYGFIGPMFHRPVSRNVMLLAGAGVNYLYYGFDSGSGGRTTVTSPGAGAKAGVRLGNRNWVQFSAGPGFKRKHRVIRDETDRIVSSERNIEAGFSLGTDVWVNPSRTNNIHGMLHYGTEDSYTWGRMAFKQQVTNFDGRSRFTHSLGTEYIGQGNQDIRSNQVGGFVEFLHAPSSIAVMLRAGYKQSAFEVGPDKTGPWYAVSFYRAFR